MPRIYKILTAVLALTGCIGLFITGELNPLMLIPAIALIPGYIRFWLGMPMLSKWTIGSLSITTLFLFLFDGFVISGDMFIAVAHLTLIFQALKSFDLKEPWDHLQVYFMALLQLIIASELTRSIAFGVIFVVFLIALVTAMVISHFLKEGTVRRIRFGGPVVTISAITLLITVFFFVSTPRAKGGYWGKSHTKGIKTAGFSEKVDFGSFGEVILNPTVVMRVEMPMTAEIPLYWQGMTLDYFDGLSWKNTIKGRYTVGRQGNLFVFISFSPDKALAQKVFLEPLDSEVIFALGTIAGTEIDSRIMLVDNAGSVFTPGKSLRRLNYTAYSIFEEQRALMNISEYLRLPSGIAKIENLAREITTGLNTDIEKATRIENYLKTNYKYSLETSPPPPGMSPIEDFLFNSKQGYCEHYATSMVLMLRAINIPSRIVTGFLGGEVNKYGGYIIVRQSNAHSWVEAAINNRWKRFDPTPPAVTPEVPSTLSLYIDSLRMKWYRYVVSFSSSDQKRLIEYLYMPFIKIPDMPDVKVRGFRTVYYAVFAIIAIILAIFLLRQLKIRRYGFVTKHYLIFRNSLKRKGGNIIISSTPSDVLKEAIRLGMQKDAGEFIRLYEMVRFGGKEFSDEEKKMYKSIAKSLGK
jgi:hypothetical protein